MQVELEGRPLLLQEVPILLTPSTIADTVRMQKGRVVREDTLTPKPVECLGS